MSWRPTQAVSIEGSMPRVVSIFGALNAPPNKVVLPNVGGTRAATTIQKLVIAMNKMGDLYPWREKSGIDYHFSPNDTPLTDSLDMALMAEAIAIDQNREGSDTLFVGEVGVDGGFLPVRSPLAIGMLAKDMGKPLAISGQSANQAALSGAEVYGLRDVVDLFAYVIPELRHQRMAPINRQQYLPTEAAEYPEWDDLKYVRGQTKAKRSLEIAVAGGHNLLLIGSPGEGKSELAKRAYTIMPPMELNGVLESNSVWQQGGRLAEGAINWGRPFVEATMQTTSTALLGGGDGQQGPVPGLVALAHNGVLLADELFQWPPGRIESLRTPLQDKQVIVSRRDWQVIYPAAFTLIATANPCPCGFLGSGLRDCVCTKAKRERYQQKASGPIMDRIGVSVFVKPLGDRSFDDEVGESSEAVRGRVVRGQQAQQSRFEGIESVGCNAELGPGMIEALCNESPSAIQETRRLSQRMAMTTRGLHTLRKVARTIADLSGCPTVEVEHVTEAGQFVGRTLTAEEVE